jgi:hypothetical protein
MRPPVNFSHSRSNQNQLGRGIGPRPFLQRGNAAAGKLDPAYVVALSDIWQTMYDYQHNNLEHKVK